MNDNDIRAALKRGQAIAEAGRVPEFEHVWAAAHRRLASRRRRWMVGGLAAASVITILAAGLLRSPQPAWQFVDPDDLVTGTRWQAPSDVLLPEYRIDIYDEIPVLIESTPIDGGTLL